jgi:hypothetical protein
MTAPKAAAATAAAAIRVARRTGLLPKPSVPPRRATVKAVAEGVRMAEGGVTMRSPETGPVGPEITATALRTNVRPDRAWVAGRPAVLLFHGRDNKGAARGIVQSVRNAYGDARAVVTVNIVDLSEFPRLVRRAVDADLDRAFDAEAANLRGDRDPESHIVIVADYDGSLTSAWDVAGADTVVNAVVLDAEWRIRARGREPGLDDLVVAALAGLVEPQRPGRPARARSARPSSDANPSSAASARQAT